MRPSLVQKQRKVLSCSASYATISCYLPMQLQTVGKICCTYFFLYLFFVTCFSLHYNLYSPIPLLKMYFSVINSYLCCNKFYIIFFLWTLVCWNSHLSSFLLFQLLLCHWPLLSDPLCSLPVSFLNQLFFSTIWQFPSSIILRWKLLHTPNGIIQCISLYTKLALTKLFPMCQVESSYQNLDVIILPSA